MRNPIDTSKLKYKRVWIVRGVYYTFSYAQILIALIETLNLVASSAGTPSVSKDILLFCGAAVFYCFFFDIFHILMICKAKPQMENHATSCLE